MDTNIMMSSGKSTESSSSTDNTSKLDQYKMMTACPEISQKKVEDSKKSDESTNLKETNEEPKESKEDLDKMAIIGNKVATMFFEFNFLDLLHEMINESDQYELTLIDESIGEVVKTFSSDPVVNCNIGLLYYCGFSTVVDYLDTETFKYLIETNYETAFGHMDIGIKNVTSKLIEENPDFFGNVFNVFGCMYFHGRGTAVDYPKAYEKILQSSILGSIIGRYNLGHLYYHGQGVEKSKQEALKCFEDAFKMGHSHAPAEICKIYEHVTSLCDVVNYLMWNVTDIVNAFSYVKLKYPDCVYLYPTK